MKTFARMSVEQTVGVRTSLQRWSVCLLAAGLMAGCVSVPSKVDLEEQRAANLLEDMERLSSNQMVLPDKPITLDEAINVAFNNNLDLRIAEFEGDIAKDNAYAERLNMLPSLTLSGHRSKRDRSRRQDFVNAQTGAIQQSNTVSAPRNTFQADLSLTWNVLDFGLSYVRSRQAQLSVKALEFRRLRQAQLLALDVTESYWRAALAEDALDYIRQVEAELKQQKDLIEDAVATMNMNPIAAKDAAKRLVDLQIIIRDLQAEVSNSKVELARLMGLRQDQPFKFSREAIRPLLAALPRPHQLDVNTLEAFALKSRPELFEQDLNEQIQQDEVRAAMLSILPDLTFGLGGHYDNNRLLNANRWNTLAVDFGWNLLSIPSKLARKRAQEDGLDMVRYQRLQNTIGVVTQVHLALLDYAVKVDRFMLLEESYTLANDLLMLVRQANGAGQVSDLAVTQRALEDVAAKLRRDRAVVESIVGYRRLLVSIGLDTRHWNENLNTLSLLEEDNLAAGQADQGSTPWQPVVNEQPTTDGYVVYEPVSGAEQGQVIEWASEPVATAQPVSRPVDSVFNWVIQTGAFSRRSAIDPVLAEAAALVPRLLERAEPIISTTRLNGKTVYRARYLGFTRSQALHACKVLKQRGMDCWIDRNDPSKVIN